MEVHHVHTRRHPRKALARICFAHSVVHLIIQLRKDSHRSMTMIHPEDHSSLQHIFQQVQMDPQTFGKNK